MLTLLSLSSFRQSSRSLYSIYHRAREFRWGKDEPAWSTETDPSISVLCQGHRATRKTNLEFISQERIREVVVDNITRSDRHPDQRNSNILALHTSTCLRETQKRVRESRRIG